MHSSRAKTMPEGRAALPPGRGHGRRPAARTSQWGRLLIVLVIGLIGALNVTLFLAEDSRALPSFARKYNAACGMCHYPVYPRLNSFGQQYRRAGYRTPIEFNAYQDFTNVNELLAGRIRSQFAYENNEGEVERSEFRFPEVAFYYSGAISRNFSAWIHATANNSTSVDFHGHIQGVFGRPERFFSVRIGQMHMLQQQGIGGFDLPTGLTTTPVNAVALTTTGAPVSFTFDQRQNGVELAYVHGPGRLLLQITNGLNQTGSGTATIGDIDPDKDFLLAYDHILDDIASGFTVFYYHGTTHGSASATAIDREFNFWRTGFNLSKIVPVVGLGFFEVQGGYTRSHDDNPVAAVPAGDLDGNAYYVELQQYITGPEVTLYERFSLLDLDLAKDDSKRKDYTLGLVLPLQTWLRLTAEYTLTENETDVPETTNHLALAELQIAF